VPTCRSTQWMYLESVHTTVQRSWAFVSVSPVSPTCCNTTAGQGKGRGQVSDKVVS
jgi:hypothetical protein